MNLEYARRMLVGYSIAVGVNQIAPCYCFQDSGDIDAKYASCPTSDGCPNPWHIGLLDPAKYPDQGHLIQGELELLAHMYTMVLELKPRLVFESGTNIGLMARALGAGCWTNGFGKVVTCDIDPRMVHYARELCQGLPVEVVDGPALNMKELSTADLVFIDSSNESRITEVTMLKKGATFVMHDTYAEQWMRVYAENATTSIVHMDGPRGFTIGRIG